MIFGWVAFAKIKLHSSSCIISSIIHRPMTHLIIVGKVGNRRRHVVLRCQQTHIMGMCIMKSYTKYVLQCHVVFYVTMITFHMTLLMNKWTNIVMDDGWVHPLAKPYPLLSSTCDEILSWIEIWMKNHLVSDRNCNTVNLYSPQKKF